MKGILKLIPVTKVHKGMQVIFSKVIYTIGNIEIVTVGYNPTQVTDVELKKGDFVMLTDWVEGGRIRTLVIEYENYQQTYPTSGRDFQGNEEYGYVKKQVPLSETQWETMIKFLDKEIHFKVNSENIAEITGYDVKIGGTLTGIMDNSEKDELLCYHCGKSEKEHITTCYGTPHSAYHYVSRLEKRIHWNAKNLHDEVKDFLEFFNKRSIDETPHTIIRERFEKLKNAFDYGKKYLKR